MRAVIVLCLVAAVYSQVPLPCQSPPQWEARELRIDRSQNYEEFRRLVYDETNQRERSISEDIVGSTRKIYDVLALWQTKKLYVVDLKTRQCNVTAIDRPFRPRGVHPDAKFAYEAEIGPASIPNEHLTVQIFSANYTDEYYTSFVTTPDCIPVQTLRYSQKYGFEESHYFDLTVGIKDPEYFAIPRECPQ